MKILDLFEVESPLMYHGTNANFDTFNINADRANRGSNVAGAYFTPHESEARTYGDRVIVARLNVHKPFFSSRQHTITPEMQSVYAKWLRRHTHHPAHWIDKVLIPSFIESGNVSMMDIPGDVKRDIILAGGYDSYVDGEHVVVLQPSSETIKRV